MYYLDISHSGQISKFKTEAVAFQQFHATNCECELRKGLDVIAEKYHIPIHDPEGDLFILETHIIEEEAEYVEL